MKYGLKEQTIDAIRLVFQKFPQIESAILYGSRAKGNYRYNSDIDLTLKGDELTVDELFKIENDLDDLLLPYKIDLTIYQRISNQALLDQIDLNGVLFYKKKS